MPIKQRFSDSVEPKVRAWHVVLTSPQHELAASLRLSMLAEIYRPRERAWSDRKDCGGCRETERSLFPGYVFAKFYGDELPDITQIFGVRQPGFLRFGANGIEIVSEEVIQQVRDLEATGVQSGHMMPTRGDRVEVKLAHSQVAGILEQDKAGRWWVATELLNRPLRVPVDRAAVRRAA